MRCFILVGHYWTAKQQIKLKWGIRKCTTSKDSKKWYFGSRVHLTGHDRVFGTGWDRSSWLLGLHNYRWESFSRLHNYNIVKRQSTCFFWLKEQGSLDAFSKWWGIHMHIFIHLRLLSAQKTNLEPQPRMIVADKNKNKFRSSARLNNRSAQNRKQ